MKRRLDGKWRDCRIGFGFGFGRREWFEEAWLPFGCVALEYYRPGFVFVASLVVMEVVVVDTDNSQLDSIAIADMPEACLGPVGLES